MALSHSLYLPEGQCPVRGMEFQGLLIVLTFGLRGSWGSLHLPALRQSERSGTPPTHGKCFKLLSLFWVLVGQWCLPVFHKWLEPQPLTVFQCPWCPAALITRTQCNVESCSQSTSPGSGVQVSWGPSPSLLCSCPSCLWTGMGEGLRSHMTG